MAGTWCWLFLYTINDMETISIVLGLHQNIYFTSDMHFGHRNVIKFCERPFENEKEMGEELIKRWNERVTGNDFVFNLGDTFWFNDRHSVKKVVSKLKGHKHFLLGNHCKSNQYELCKDMDLQVHSDITVLQVRIQPDDPRFVGRKHFYEIVLSHYPLLCYSHSQNGAYNFFGHIHSRKGTPMTEFGKPLVLPHNQYMDVGVDRHDYAPVSLLEVLDEIDNYSWWN